MVAAELGKRGDAGAAVEVDQAFPVQTWFDLGAYEAALGMAVCVFRHPQQRLCASIP